VHTSVRLGSNDEGETLIELVIAVAITGISVVAIVGGIATSILMSDIHRKQATSGAYVRDYAEAVVGHYDPSASPDYVPLAVGFTAPTGFNAAVTSVKCWKVTSGIGEFSDCTATNAVQQVTLKVASTDSRASESLVVVVRKP
jgi:type II secretory pathway pseudopilin PulG